MPDVRTSKNSFGGAIGALMLALSLLLMTDSASAQTTTYENAAKDALKQLNNATKTAKKNIPRSRGFKNLEDKLDQAARKNADTPNTANQKAEDAARAKANSFRGRSTADQIKRADKYREALRERREARKKLIDARKEAKKGIVKSRQQGFSSAQSLNRSWFNKLSTAVKKSEQTISKAAPPKAATNKKKRPAAHTRRIQRSRYPADKDPLEGGGGD